MLEYEQELLNLTNTHSCFDSTPVHHHRSTSVMVTGQLETCAGLTGTELNRRQLIG